MPRFAEDSRCETLSEYLGWFIHVWQALTEPSVANVTKNEPISIFVLNETENRSQFPCVASQLTI